MIRRPVIFDSRISKKANAYDLKVTYVVTEEELAIITKLYQVYKARKLTKAPTIELFFKDLVFGHMEFFKTECDYDGFYPDEKKEKK
jgi:hypothetical protein